jgi:uncharacterized membrane protein
MAESRDLGRLEAFSDGVLAIAMTLLVLDLREPIARQGLGPFLLHQWPTYVAYLASFLTIGIIWLNHTAVIGMLTKTDHPIRVLNLLLLLAISVIPYPTSLLARYSVGHYTTSDERWAVVAYGGVMILMSVAFNLLWRRIRSHPELRRPGITLADLSSRHRRFNLGLVLYPALTVIGLFAIEVFLIGLVVVAALYLLPTADPDIDEP